MSELILFHGSQNIVEKPRFGYGKPYNDYGQGFYCTESKELAKEWAVSEESNGYVNQYSIETDCLKILNLQKYTMLHWLALLVHNRQFEASTPVMNLGKEWLKENFLISTKDFDLIKGYRADDSYFSFAKAFLSNQISYTQLSAAMKLGSLGEQIMLKSKKAFDSVKFESFEEADFHLYFSKKKSRDEEARQNYKKILEESDIEGLFIRDIIREKIKKDDPRIQ